MAAGLVACSPSVTVQEPKTTATTSTPASSLALPTATAVPEPTAAPGYVSRGTWTDGPWPLTVDSAILECQGESRITISVGGSQYALNAAAHAALGLPDYANAIGVPDPARPGFHLDAGPLIQRGIALCSGSSSSTPPSTPSGGSNRPAGLVERETWTDGPWPFTVDSATLFCTSGAGGDRLTVVANREMYALNGTAKSSGLYPPFDAIWADDSNADGLKVNIGPMIDHGLALCR
ncbi:DUF2511 domain-containing protein [Mycolicibacterium fluoranthenivorans]|uniref:DUF2511 domain-containing protein n=1 Tax=Mycolicibacterium fluoranthenivorans TaxID=258505 RepID=UPI001F15DD15|nr:DUF2511 domain-containing protein [Mycolicibacterium fluoranthenivorans]